MTEHDEQRPVGRDENEPEIDRREFFRSGAVGADLGATSQDPNLRADLFMPEEH